MTFSLHPPVTIAETLRAVNALTDEAFTELRWALLSGESLEACAGWEHVKHLRLEGRTGALLFLLVSDHRLVALATTPLLDALTEYADGGNWTDMVYDSRLQRDVTFRYDEVWQGEKHGHTIARRAVAEWKEKHGERK